MRLKLLALALPLLISGCSLVPDHATPAMPTAAGYDRLDEAASDAALPQWRSFMADDTLQQLVETALANNRDLRQTLLNVEAYRAQYRIQDAALYPTIAASAASSNQRVPEAYSGTDSRISRTHSAGLGFTSYELDLFGRVRALSEQALETYLAQEETARSTRIALVAEVAATYLTLVAYDQLLGLAEQTEQTSRETLQLVQTRFDAGIDSAMTLAQAKTAVHNAEAAAAQYRRSREQQHNALRVLLAAPLPPGLATSLPADDGQLLPPLTAGAPSTLLQARPDIRAAEHALRAANASVGAARAAFFPAISLTATAGSMSSSLDDLFASNSGTWTFTPSLSLPIFDWGSREASLDLAKVRKEVTVVQYQAAIESAFREVADALAGQSGYQAEREAQRANVAANQRYFDLARLRYEKGTDSYLTLLDAQRSLFAAQQAEVAAHLNLLTSRITLYKALGGGWQTEP